jgi:peptidoglycan/LPS O-acetylase OafA/YrhL
VRERARTSLSALTGARFLAAYWVLAYHCVIQFRFDPLPGKPATTGALPAWLAPVILQGHLAVDFFFLLSGFILAYTYIGDEGTLRGTRRAFWVARIARIYPVYLLGLILGFWPFLQIEPNPAIVALSTFTHLFMLHGWIPVALDLNQPSWSLSVEATFYLAFPFVLPLAGRLRRRGLWLLFAGSWLLFGAICLTLQALSDHGLDSLLGWRDIVRYNPAISFPEFIAGMALGLLFTRYGAAALPWLRGLRGWAFDALITGALALFAVVMLVIYNIGLSNSPVDIAAPFALPALAALILLLAFQRGAVAWLLSTPALVWLGEISYAVYILHKPIWSLLSGPLWAALNPLSLALTHRPASNLALLLAFSALVVACAGISFQIMERPLRRWIRQTWAAPRARQATGEPEGART